MPRKLSVAPSAKIILCIGLEGGEKTRLLRDLARFGYKAISATLEQGLGATMKEGELRLVILDLFRRPEKALSLLRELRAHAPGVDLPVLLLTPLAGMDRIPGALEAGADDYLLKPVDSRLLFSRVQQLAEAFPRAHCRVPCEVPLEVLSRSGFMTGETMEVSEGGLRGVLPRKVPSGDLVVLRFHLPRRTEQIAAAAVCVFQRKAGDGWALGFKFVLIERNHQKRIQRFIEQAGAQSPPAPPPPPPKGKKR